MLVERVLVSVLVGSLLGSGSPELWSCALGGSRSLAAGQRGPETAGQRPVVRRSPVDRPSAEMLPEAAARVLFEEKVIRRHPEAWKESLAAKKARGWKHVGRFAGVRIERAKNVVPVSQSQRYNSGDGLVIEYVWNCGTADSHCSTFYIESYAYGTSISYDVEFVPTGDLSGYSRWAYPIGVDAGRDERRQRAGWKGPQKGPAVLLASTGSGGPGQSCPGDGFYWRRCMRECIRSHHENVMIGTAVSAGTSLLVCFGPTRADPSQFILYAACVSGWSLVGFALMAVDEFLLSSPCDSAAGGCGPNPC